MTDPDLVSHLTELLEAAPGADAFHLRLEDEFASGLLTEAQVDALFAELKADFDRAVEEVAGAWGPPTYEGTVDRDDFPAWSEALVLAFWQRGDAVAYVALRHDDDHQPMFLEIGALSDDEIATLGYTKS
jgi:hypothetical protein